MELFMEMELSSLIFQEVTFRVWKMKKVILKKGLIFLEMEISCPKLKKLLIFFSGGTYKA